MDQLLPFIENRVLFYHDLNSIRNGRCWHEAMLELMQRTQRNVKRDDVGAGKTFHRYSWNDHQRCPLLRRFHITLGTLL